MGREQDGRPLGREGFDGGSGGDLGGFDLEDTELGSLGTLVGGLIGFFAERAFGQAGTGLAGGYELAGKLDEVGGDVDGRADVFEGGGLAEGDLVLEGEGFGFIERVLSLSLVPATGGGGLRIAAGYLVCVVEPDGEAGGGVLRDGWRRWKRFGDQRRCSGSGCGGRGRGRQGPLIEIGEELVLGVGDGLGVESGGLGCSLSRADGLFGLLGEEGAVALRVGVALGHLLLEREGSCGFRFVLCFVQW